MRILYKFFWQSLCWEIFALMFPLRTKLIPTPLILVHVKSTECVIKRSWASGPAAIAAEEPLQALGARVSSREDRSICCAKWDVSSSSHELSKGTDQFSHRQRSQRSNAWFNVKWILTRQVKGPQVGVWLLYLYTMSCVLHRPMQGAGAVAPAEL